MLKVKKYIENLEPALSANKKGFGIALEEEESWSRELINKLGDKSIGIIEESNREKEDRPPRLKLYNCLKNINVD